MQKVENIDETPAFVKHVLPAVPSSEVYLEDCVKALKRFNDNHFDLAIVDPPYGIGEDGAKNHSRRQLAKPTLYTAKNWDREIPSDEYFAELKRVSKNQIIWGGNYFVDKLPITEAWICWHKKPFLKQQAHFELAWTSFEMKPKMIEYTYAGNCEGLKNVRVDYTKKSIHPAQKPENIYKLLLQDYAKEGFKIIDTHLGSGTIALACWDMKMNLDAWEINTEYFNKACKQLEDKSRILGLW